MTQNEVNMKINNCLSKNINFLNPWPPKNLLKFMICYFTMLFHHVVIKKANPNSSCKVLGSKVNSIPINSVLSYQHHTLWHFQKNL